VRVKKVLGLQKIQFNLYLTATLEEMDSGSLIEVKTIEKTSSVLSIDYWLPNRGGHLMGGHLIGVRLYANVELG